MRCATCARPSEMLHNHRSTQAHRTSPRYSLKCAKTKTQLLMAVRHAPHSIQFDWLFLIAPLIACIIFHVLQFCDRFYQHYFLHTKPTIKMIFFAQRLAGEFYFCYSYAENGASESAWKLLLVPFLFWLSRTKQSAPTSISTIRIILKDW